MPSDGRSPSDSDLKSLEPEARKLVEAANLAGRPIPLEVAATLIDASLERTVSIAERLVGDGLLDSESGSLSAVQGQLPLSPIRTAYLYRELANAFTAEGHAARVPAAVAEYLLGAGDAEAAIPFIGAAAEQEVSDVIELVEAGVAVIQAEGVGVAADEGRLRLERAKYHQTMGSPELAVDDLQAAIRLLDGVALVDALGFLAAILDNRQLPQGAEVYAAAGAAQALAIGEPEKAASLLVLQARILNRIGFPAEADASLTKGADTLREGGNPYQRFLATVNTARIALSRGQAVRAEPLFARAATVAGNVAGPAVAAETAAWLARAQFLHDRPQEGLESVATATALADTTEATGPLFLAHMGHAEGASRFGASADALSAADAMLAAAREHLPQWENAARYLRARALLGMGRVDEAGEEVERALQLTPDGINGRRWRRRIEALQLEVLADQGAQWPRAHAEDLTDELLQSQWLDVAAELMALRAGVEGDQGLARQAAALALDLGIPTTAAKAIEAGDLWSDPVAAPVARAVKNVVQHVPEHWQDGWASQAEVASALTAPDVVDDELTAAAAALQADFDAAIVAAGLADPDVALSPAQRRAEGLVRRRQVRRRPEVWLGPVAAVASVLLFAVVAVLGWQPLEDRQLTQLPTTFTGQWVTLGGDPGRTGAGNGTGVAEARGYFWRHGDSQAQFRASPVVIGQKVVVGSIDGEAYLIDRRRGAELSFPVSTGGSIDSAAVGVARRAGFWAIVPSGEAGVRAYDLANGQLVWDAPVDSWGTPAVDLGAERVYVGGAAGLHVLDLVDGREMRPWPEGESLSAPITTDITLGDGFVYFGSDDSLYQVDAATGAVTECEAPPGAALVTPVVNGGVVYVASGLRLITLLDTGTCTWRNAIFIGEELTVKPAVHDGIVYQPGQRGVSAYDLRAPNAEQGHLWGPAPIRDGELFAPVVRSSPTVAGGLVYFGANDGYVYALDAETGELAWEWNVGVPVRAPVAVTDGVVYVATTGGEVIAIGGEPGSSLSIPTTTTPPISTPTTGSGPGAG